MYFIGNIFFLKKLIYSINTLKPPYKNKGIIEFDIFFDDIIFYNNTLI